MKFLLSYCSEVNTEYSKNKCSVSKVMLNMEC